MARAGMQIRPIWTERDHERALSRIGELMSARPGTPEGNKMDVLAMLVDAYESKHTGLTRLTRSRRFNSAWSSKA